MKTEFCAGPSFLTLNVKETDAEVRWPPHTGAVQGNTGKKKAFEMKRQTILSIQRTAATLLRTVIPL